MPGSFRPQQQPMEEIAAVLNKFGDGQSTLMDHYERRSVEARLNQAILGRSLSEPSTVWPNPFHAAAVDGKKPEEKGRKRRLGIGKVLKKLIKPFLGNGKIKKGAVADYSRNDPSNPNIDPSPTTYMNRIPVYSKAFSRSLRV